MPGKISLQQWLLSSSAWRDLNVDPSPWGALWGTPSAWAVGIKLTPTQALHFCQIQTCWMNQRLGKVSGSCCPLSLCSTGELWHNAQEGWGTWQAGILLPSQGGSWQRLSAGLGTAPNSLHTWAS